MMAAHPPVWRRRKGKNVLVDPQVILYEKRKAKARRDQKDKKEVIELLHKVFFGDVEKIKEFLHKADESKFYSDSTPFDLIKRNVYKAVKAELIRLLGDRA